MRRCRPIPVNISYLLFMSCRSVVLQVTLSIKMSDSQLEEFERTIPVKLAQPPWNYTLALSKGITVLAHRSQKIQGTLKSNPLGKNQYLWNCSNFFRQFYTVFRSGSFWPHILQILLQYLVTFKNITI